MGFELAVPLLAMMGAVVLAGMVEHPIPAKRPDARFTGF